MFIKNPSRSDSLIEVNGRRGFNPIERGATLVYLWFQDKKGIGAGVYCHETRRELSFSLGQYTTVFQAEVHAIKACAVENLDREYKKRNSYILSESHAAIKALGKYHSTSKLVSDCQQSLIQLARHDRVQLM
jgi:hypothetical protein